MAVEDDYDGVPESLEELAEVYQVSDVPVDILMVVDMSTSMILTGDPPPWDQVVDGYRAFVDAASPHDSLALITFARHAETTLLPEPLSSDAAREQAKAALPKKHPAEKDPNSPRYAQYQATDMGAALRASITLLDKQSDAETQIMVFITDGRHDPPATSPYQGTTGPPWRQLARDGRDLLSRHGDRLTVYGRGLGPPGATDIDLVQQVFPKAQIISVSSAQLQRFLKGVAVDALRSRVRPEVQTDLDQPVTASLSIDSLSPDVSGTLTLHNPRKGLATTVNLNGLTITERGGEQVPVVIESQTIQLAPGESAEVPVLVQPSGADHGLEIGELTDERTWTVEVDALTELPKSSTALLRTQNLADPADTRGPVENQTPALTASASFGIAPWKLVVGLLALIGLLVALTLFLRWLLVAPQLTGYLERRYPDGTYRQEVRLRGKEITIPSDSVSAGETDDQVRLFTKPRKRSTVFAARSGGSPRLNDRLMSSRPTRVAGHASLQIGSAVFRYVRTKSETG